jgi:hypothetical protein
MTAGSDDIDFGDHWNNHLDDAWPNSVGSHRLDTGGTQLIDVVAAVDHLARGLRPNFTVWDALEEALRWWLNDRTGSAESPGGDDSDLLRSRLRQLDAALPATGDLTMADVLQQADRYNAGYQWPHPAARRGFPPQLVYP